MENCDESRFNVYPARAVRDERWKHIRNLHPEFAFTTHIDLVAGRLGQRAFFSTWETAAQTNAQAAAILQRYHARPAEELYDLASDPTEQSNLAGEPRWLSDPSGDGPEAEIADPQQPGAKKKGAK